MKVKLNCGEVQIGVKYGTRKIKLGKDKTKNEVVAVRNGNTTKLMAKPKIHNGKPVVVPAPEINQRFTEMQITLPSGQLYHVTVACDSKDEFSYATGRHAALLKIFGVDTAIAIDSLKKKTKSNGDDPVDMVKVKKFYNLSRDDRTLLFKTICKNFFRNEPARVEQREKAMFEKLKAKYEPEVQ